MKQGRRRSSSFCTNGHVSFEKCWKGGKAPKVQRSSCTPRWYCERRLRVLRCIHWTRIFSISNDSSQNHGYHLLIAGLRWTSSRRSISLYPSKKGRCSQLIENFQNRSVQTFGFVPRHKGQNHGQVWKTQLFLLSGICTVILWQDYYGKGNLRKSFWNMAGRKFQIVNVSFYIVKKDDSYLCMCGWHKIGGKETKSWSDVETTQQRSRFGRTNVFLVLWKLGLHSTKMWNKKILWTITEPCFESPISAGGVDKLPFTQNHRISSWSYDMEGHSKNVWSDSVNWPTRRLNNSTKYLRHASMTTTSKKKKWNLLQNCHMYALWNAYTWQELDDLIFYCQ